MLSWALEFPNLIVLEDFNFYVDVAAFLQATNLVSSLAALELFCPRHGMEIVLVTLTNDLQLD